eukprot:1170172-Pyramimonas_sp.AAC.1
MGGDVAEADTRAIQSPIEGAMLCDKLGHVSLDVVGLRQSSLPLLRVSFLLELGAQHRLKWSEL